MSYGETVRVRREALGLSQRELARRSGVHQPVISAVEAGKREASAGVAQALDGVLMVRPSEMLRHLRGPALDVVERHRGRSAQVFGSVAAGQDVPGSDIDLLVSFEEGASILDLLAMEEELADLLLVPVDIVSAGSSGRVVERALSEAVPL